MKKVIFIFFFCIAEIAIGQNIQHTYLDAVKLEKIFKQNQVGTNLNNIPLYDDFYEILLHYGLNESNIDSNLFFKGFVIKENNMVSANNGSETLKDIPYNEPEAKFSTLSSTDWQSSVINGLADFMAGRFKAESLHMALEQIFKRIQGEDAAVIQALFPQTFAQISGMYHPKKSDSYYTADLLFLRQLILSDIEKMPENIVQSKFLLDQLSATEYDLLQTTYRLSKYSRAGFSVEDIIRKIAQQDFKNEKIKEVVSLTYLFSEALRDTLGSENNWVNPLIQLKFKLNEINQLHVRFFYGLLYEQLRGTVFFDKIEHIDSEKLAHQLQELLLFANNLNAAYDYAKEKKFKFKDVEEYLVYLQELSTSFQHVLKSKLISSYLEMNNSLFKLSGAYIRIMDPFLKKDYQRAVPVLISELSNYLSNEQNIQYTRSVSFLSQLATIKNEDELEKLLQASALPIGSSSIKRNSRFNISVNGYVGFTGGRETAYGDLGSQIKWNMGLSAPIGIALTSHKVTLFGSIIDLGTIVSVRLNNDVSAYSDLKFENFLAPGVGLYYNLPKAPITIGTHYNYIPNLRTIQLQNGTSTVTETGLGVTRINFSVLIDIPFFTLYNKPKKNHK